MHVQRAEAVLGENASLGRRLLVRRRELGHRIFDAATLAGVDAKTWMWWERGAHEPTVGQYPAIIRYLEYEPWPEPVSLSEKLLVQRRRMGISMERAAEITGVDEGTYGRWERGEWKPRTTSVLLLERFLCRTP